MIQAPNVIGSLAARIRLWFRAMHLQEPRRRGLTTWRTIEYRKTNEVKTESERRGLNPPDAENSFHIKDPNGFDLQISGKDMNLPSVSRLRSLSVEARFILSL